MAVRFGGVRSGVALAVLAGSQLLIVLDATIVNVALSAIEADLGFRPAELSWVVTAYTLAFGGLLVLGGRLADRCGRRRLFTFGAGGFAVGSALAALAWSPVPLIVGRVVQGASAAMLTPAGLSLLLVVFADGRARDRALGVWATVTAGGTALGLVLGGLLTATLSWEWIFWVNVPIAGAAAACAGRVLPESTDRGGPRFNIVGTALATVGLGALVYALTRSAEVGWSSAHTTGGLLAAVALLAGFGWSQRNHIDGVVPKSISSDRTVVAADLVALIFGVAIYGLFYFLSLFLGGPLDYDAVQIGAAFLPMAGALAASVRVAGRLQSRISSRRLLLAGLLLVAAGLASLGRIDTDSTYVTVLLPALVAVGVGMGLGFVALTNAAVTTADPAYRGVASGLFNAAQQIGGAVGLAVLTAAAEARIVAVAGDTGTRTRDAMASGWALTFLLAAALMLLAAAVTAVWIHPDRSEPRASEAHVTLDRTASR